MDEKALRTAVQTHKDKLKPPYDEIMQVVGFEGLSMLSQEFGGTYMYIPRRDRLFSGCVAEAVKQEYDGGNIRDLAKKYGLTGTTLRNIIFKR